uniref:Retrovirus-related Pol polyprotein from transposon TNT 1-94 n=1 Tax=Cannabis sativa TaxID=3483 RepID=A0A803PEB7_CANSA
MTAAKYDVKKFIGTNDFGLWRMKMKALLAHQGLYEAMLGEKSLLDFISEKDKKETLIKAHSAIILTLGDKILRKALYSFKMMEDKSVAEQIDEFNKLIMDLKNIGVAIEDEDQALLLLISLPNSFGQFKDTMLCGRGSITLDGVESTFDSKELNQRSDLKKFESGDGLYERQK